VTDDELFGGFTANPDGGHVGGGGAKPPAIFTTGTHVFFSLFCTIFPRLASKSFLLLCVFVNWTVFLLSDFVNYTFSLFLVFPYFTFVCTAEW
jgi:hypothetical protein